MDFAKHTSEGQEIKRLEEVIALRDKEIHDIKYSLADILEEIRNLNEQNDYGQPEVKRRKISELCTNTRYEFLIDEIGILKNRTTIADQSNK